MNPDCPQTLIECPLCKSLHHGACNRRYFHAEMRRRRKFSKGFRHWLRSDTGPAPQAGGIPDVCDAADQGEGAPHSTANRGTAVQFTHSPNAVGGSIPEQAISCADPEGNGKCGATNAMQTRLSRKPENGSPGERPESGSAASASVTAGETAQSHNLPSAAPVANKDEGRAI